MQPLSLEDSLGENMATHSNILAWRTPMDREAGQGFTESGPSSPLVSTHHHRGSGRRSVVSDSLQPPWTVAHQAPLSMGFSKQEYWSGLPVPSPGDHPNPGIEPRSPALQADSLPTGLYSQGPWGPWVSGSLLLL